MTIYDAKNALVTYNYPRFSLEVGDEPYREVLDLIRTAEQMGYEVEDDEGTLTFVQPEDILRIIDGDYNLLLLIRSGGYIDMVHPDGEVFLYQVTLIDNYHLKVGDVIYHSKELGDMLTRANITVRRAQIQ